MSPFRCPKCGGPGRWRNGVGFEHEKICTREHLHGEVGGSVIWCPYDIEDQQKAVADSKINTDGDGI